MGHDLYQREPEARAVFDRADELLGFPLSEICFSGPEEVLTETVNQQPALYVTSLAVWQVLQEHEQPAPSYLAGHSLGEFSALAAAGSLTFADGLTLVRRRGQLMQAAGEEEPGAMAAVLALNEKEVAAICAQVEEANGHPLQVANDNCPGQVVISGHREALSAATERLKSAGARKVVALPITIAAHSPLMKRAAAAFAEAVAATPVARPVAPVIGNTTARPLLEPADIRAEMTSQLTGSVRWTESMRYLLEQGVDTFVEVGPGDVLTGLMKRIDRQVSRVRLELAD